MKLVTCITRPEQLETIEQSLADAGVLGMTVTEVRGRGRQGGRSEHFRGAVYEVRLLEKVKIELLLPDDRVSSAINLLMAVARTGNPGDGLIFVSEVENAWRIRTGESGPAVFNYTEQTAAIEG